MVAGPDWKGETPKGITKVFNSDTEFTFTIFRTQLFNPADMPNVQKVQAGYKVQPLSAFLGQPAPAAAPAIDWPALTPAASSARCSPVVQLETATAYAAPTCSANSFSKAATSGPCVIQPDMMTRAAACASRSSITGLMIGIIS